jgi:DNA primase
MRGRIPQNFIDDLLARTDIVELIDSHVPLKKTGQNYQALCPFHDEKTPSFSVRQDKQFFHCFGCGANGNAITFLMEYNRLEFVEAIEDLAGRAGLTIPREEGDKTPGKDHELTEMYELMELVINFYRKQLRDHPQAGQAVDYLRQRGITGELAARFELGYAPDNWDSLIRELGQSEPALNRLLKTGMVIRKDNGGFYDRFRQRIIYPIRDQRGRAIGFGGRIINEGNPKYLNSPETPIFHKGHELYGLYQARHASGNLPRLYVVEGYMDVLALAQFGINNTVATLGTAVTREHMERIFRSTTEVIFCFDGDEAGRKAAWRALETALPLLRDGRQAYFMFMPQDQDPDDFIRAHGQQQFLDSSQYQSLSDYLLENLTRDFNPAIREHKGKLVHNAIPYLQKLPQGSLKQLLFDKIAALTDTEPGMLDEFARQENSPGRKLVMEKAPGREDRKLVAVAIKLLLQQPRLALLVADTTALESIKSTGTDFLVELIRLIRQNPDMSCARILEHWRGTRFEKRLMQLAPAGQSRYATDEAYLETGEYLQSEFLGAIAQLREDARKKRLIEFSRITSIDSLTEDQKELLRNLNPAARNVNQK